jgi:hypothetical protein
MANDAKLIAAAILLGHKLGGDSNRQATDADVKGAVANVEKLEEELRKVAEERATEGFAFWTKNNQPGQ